MSNLTIGRLQLAFVLQNESLTQTKVNLAIADCLPRKPTDQNGKSHLLINIHFVVAYSLTYFQRKLPYLMSKRFEAFGVGKFQSPPTVPLSVSLWKDSEGYPTPSPILTVPCRSWYQNTPSHPPPLQHFSSGVYNYEATPTNEANILLPPTTTPHLLLALVVNRPTSLSAPRTPAVRTILCFKLSSHPGQRASHPAVPVIRAEPLYQFRFY